jgi:hypothetical protein
MGMACSTKGATRSAYRVLVGNSEGKRPQGKTRHRWVDSINIGWGGMDWIDMAHDTDQ